MGNTTDKSSPSDIFSSFLETNRDSLGVHLKHKQSQLPYLLRQYTYSSDAEYERHRNLLERDSVGEWCQFMLGVYRVRNHTVQGLCSTTHKIYAIYQYPQVTLLDQIAARSQDHKLFDQNQLWSIIQSCRTAHKHLKTSVCLTPQLVFVTADGQLKVIHGDLFDQNYRYSYDHRFNYAPEKMLDFNKLDSEQGLLKEGMFGIGMTVLMAALVITQNQCYDHKNQQFLESALELMLESVSDKYSSEFVELLTAMVRIDPEQRLTFEELDTILEQYWGSGENAEGSVTNLIQSQRRLMQSQQKGIIRNLVTISSQQKQSIRPCHSQLPSKVGLLTLAKISESIPYQPHQPNSHFLNLSLTQPITNPTKNKENIYTDPKLLEMIKKDLAQINKLKQSTLTETIKFSFLYPGSANRQ